MVRLSDEKWYEDEGETLVESKAYDNRFGVNKMSEPKIVWIIQLTKEDKEFFDKVASDDGDKAYGNGARYVKRILENFRRDYQDVREE
jgi:hypothetical protein